MKLFSKEKMNGGRWVGSAYWVLHVAGIPVKNVCVCLLIHGQTCGWATNLKKEKDEKHVWMDLPWQLCALHKTRNGRKSEASFCVKQFSGGTVDRQKVTPQSKDVRSWCPMYVCVCVCLFGLDRRAFVCAFSLAVSSQATVDRRRASSSTGAKAKSAGNESELVFCRRISV